MSFGPKDAEFVDGDPAWRTKSDELVLVEEMTDKHLLNTIQCLRRIHDSKAYAMAGATTALGIDAEGSEEGVAGYDQSGPEATTHRIYPRLLEEVLRRNLTNLEQAFKAGFEMGVREAKEGRISTRPIKDRRDESEEMRKACPGDFLGRGAWSHGYRAACILYCRGFDVEGLIGEDSREILMYLLAHAEIHLENKLRLGGYLKRKRLRKRGSCRNV